MSNNSNAQSENFKFEGYQSQAPLPPEFEMILAYRRKVKEASAAAMQLEGQAAASAVKEPLGLVLEKNRVLELLNQEGCEGLIAFFAVEPDTNKNTIVLMGLDQQAELLRMEDGMFGLAAETWGVKVQISDDPASEDLFRGFFGISK